MSRELIINHRLHGISQIILFLIVNGLSPITPITRILDLCVCPEREYSPCEKSAWQVNM